MKFLNFVIDNWESISALLFFLLSIIAAIVKKDTTIFKNILFKLITDAENEFGAGTGKLKKEAVIQWGYDLLPSSIKTIVTYKRLSKWVESALDYAKAEWEKNPRLLNS